MGHVPLQAGKVVSGMSLSTASLSKALRVFVISQAAMLRCVGGTARKKAGGQILHYDTLLTDPQLKSNAN